jgi:hypothetical protein
MAKIDSLYKSSLLFNETIPTTETFNSAFNYSIAENLYGSDILLYTGQIPGTNPLASSGDGDKYAVNGVDIIEKIEGQVLSTVEDSYYAFTDSRMTYVIPNGLNYPITLFSKDAAGDYTVVIPASFYDVFYYQATGTYVIYFNERYAPIYNNGLLDNPSYPPAITCYRYCGPKGIENMPAGTDEKAKVSSNDTTAGYLNGKLVAGSNITFTENNNGGNETLTIAASGGLSGTDYVYVAASGTATGNGTALVNAYTTAKTMSPSASRRITVICSPGRYQLASNLTLDTEYIDLVSLDGNRSIAVSGALLIVNTNNVFLKGFNFASDSGCRIDFNNATNLVIHNCVSNNATGTNNFGLNSTGSISGYFKDCDVIGQGFTNNSATMTLSGTFINCTTTGNGFGAGSSRNNILSGIFRYCANCTNEGNTGFCGPIGTFSGTMEYCTINGIYTMGCIMNGITGTVLNTVNNYSTGAGDTAFTRLKSTARIYYCRISGGSGTFGTVDAGGRVYYSIDGNGNVNNQ